VPQRVITIFAGAPLDASPEVNQHIQVRRAEDYAALTYLGLGEHIIHLGLVNGIHRTGPDGRRRYHPRKMCGQVNRLDRPLVGEIVAQVVARFPDPRSVRLFAPLGVGQHVDHLLTHRAARELLRRGYVVGFYEDLPYALAKPGAVRRHLKERLGWTGEELVLKEDHVARKIEALRYYRSQIPALFGGDDQMNESLRAFAAGARGKGRRYVERMWYLP